MQRLGAMGNDASQLLHQPLWMGPFWIEYVKGAEKLRSEWGEHDGTATIIALGEAM